MKHLLTSINDALKIIEKFNKMNHQVIDSDFATEAFAILNHE